MTRLTPMQIFLGFGHLSLRLTLLSLLCALCALTWGFAVAATKNAFSMSVTPESGDLIGAAIFVSSFGMGVVAMAGVYTSILIYPTNWAPLNNWGMVGIDVGLAIASIGFSLKVFALVKSKLGQKANGFGVWLACMAAAWAAGGAITWRIMNK